jgi:hypothetical protein
MLQTPEVLGPSNTEVAALHDKWSTFNRVQERLRLEGFAPLPQPMYACPGYLDVETLTSHNSRLLTMEFAKYKAWRDFTAERLVYSLQILLETRNEMRAIETRVKDEARKVKRKLTKEEAQEEARTNPRYEALRLQEQENMQLELMYETKEKEFSSAVALISRVITMRGQDIDQGQRGNTVGSGPYPPGGDFR